MVRDWRGIAASDLVRCHNVFFGARWHLDEEVFRAKTCGAEGFDWGVSLVHQHDDGAVRGMVAFKRAPTRWRTRNPDALHLTTLGFENAEIGFGLMREAIRRAADRGFEAILFGRDAEHIWPGAPCESASLSAFLQLNGFEGEEECFDLERDLDGFVSPFTVPADAELRALRSGEEGDLDGFLAAEFPGRWRTDTMGKVRDEGPGAAFVVRVGSGIEGFALLQTDRARRPIGGAVWRGSLGERWSALGPIGVAAGRRGGGYGGALLGAALEHLARGGARRCIIDWTTLDRFYGKCGFEPTRRYRGMTLRLGESAGD